MTRWAADDHARFQNRRYATGTLTTASIRKSAGRRTRPAKAEPSQTQIHMSIASQLRHRAAPGVWWCHVPNGEKRDPRDGAKLKQMGAKAGAADFILIITGRVFGLELKAEAGPLSAEQRACHAAIQGAGGFCATAWGIDSALAILKTWGALAHG